jgi:hypothetical protein
MSMPANPARFVAFLALVRRRRTTGVSDREDRSLGSQEIRRVGEFFFKRQKERKERKEKKRLLTF